MVTSRRIVRSALLFVLILATACTPTPGEPGVAQAPEIFVFPGPTEKILISTEDIPQNNCDGSAEKSATVERSHTVMRTVDLGTSITVDAGGQAGIPGVGQVGVGVAVANHYQVGYGSQDTVTRSETVAAAVGTNILHTIRQYEIWETGELLISAAGENQRIPYRFRKDFSMETLPPAKLDCPGQAVMPVDPGVATQPETDSSTVSQTPPDTEPEPPASGVTASQLDGIFGNGNWFCFPDRNNGVGVKMLPVNFLVAAPLKYVDTFRGRFSPGETELGGTGGTADLTVSLSGDQCPSWQQNALSSWRAARTIGQQITSATQLDEIFGQGNWGCLSDYPFGAKVYYLNTNLTIEYPFTTADANEYKYGVGEMIPAGSSVTVWFAGAIPRAECP